MKKILSYIFKKHILILSQRFGQYFSLKINHLESYKFILSLILNQKLQYFESGLIYKNAKKPIPNSIV